jgi:hypothetical protein
MSKHDKCSNCSQWECKNEENIKDQRVISSKQRSNFYQKQMKSISYREVVQICTPWHTNKLIMQVPSIINNSFYNHAIKYSVPYVNKWSSQIMWLNLQQYYRYT